MVKGVNKIKLGNIMEAKVKRSVIKEATKIYSRIYPCGSRSELEECFTSLDDVILFWFNTIDKNTHVMMISKVTKKIMEMI